MIKFVSIIDSLEKCLSSLQFNSKSVLYFLRSRVIENI